MPGFKAGDDRSTTAAAKGTFVMDLSPFAVPSAQGNYSSVQNLSSLGLDTSKPMVFGLSFSAPAGVLVSGYFVQDPSATGQDQMPGVPQVVLNGNAPQVIVQQPAGTKVIWQRLDALGGSYNVLVSGQQPANSSGGITPSGPLTSLTPFVQANLATGGPIGTNAATTVDTSSSFDVAQTTAAQTLSFFAPTNPAVDKVQFVSNDGSASFVLYGQTIIPTTFAIIKYNSVSASYTRAGYASLGGDAMGVPLTVGTNDNNAFSLAANAKVWGTSDGTTTTLGVAPGTVAASGLNLVVGTGGILQTVAAGGQTHVGGSGVAFTVAADSYQIRTGQNGPIALAAGGTGVLALSAGNPGIQLNSAVIFGSPVAIADGTGSLGTAATTVDISSRLVVTQVTAIVTQANMRLLQPPTVLTAGRRCIVESAETSTAAFTVGDVTLAQGVNLQPGQSCEFEFNGAHWIVLAEPSPQDPIQGAALSDAVATSARAGRITQYVIPAATLSMNRVNTLAATSARKGDVMIITRYDVTANTYSVVGSETFVMVASKQNFCQFRYDGAAWQLEYMGMN